uniref:Uncharacterized protein n=1 Tax=Hyaloperonospora arabidopsidis (strain Emoy2) TaxID=559515 RepID=M4BF84_HYAAE
MAVLDPRSVGFHRGRAALPATSCGRGRHRKEVNASLYRQPQPFKLQGQHAGRREFKR